MVEGKANWAAIAQMTIKKVNADPKDAIRQSKQVFLCRIFGEATDVVVKEARTGDMYSYLIGEFRAQNAIGERFESSKLFLPGSLQEGLVGQLKAADGKSVQFGFDIFANPDEKSSVGYAYAAKQVVKTATTDRLEEMSNALDSQNPVKVPGAETATKEVEEKKTTKK